MTLIELLIVVVILITLTAAVLPILTPSTDERRIREASRELNSYLSQVQAKAIGTQRPYGVALKRLSSETGRAEDRGVCLEVLTVEQPVPYAGFGENSAARVALNGTPNEPVIAGFPFPTVLIQFVTRGNAADSGRDRLPEGWDTDLVPEGMLRPCDIIEIAGNRYQLQHPEVVVGNNSGLPLLPTSVVGERLYFNGVSDSNQPPPVIVARPLNDTGQMIQPVADNLGRTEEPPPGSGIRLMDGWLRRARGGTATEEPEPPFWTQPDAYKLRRQPTPTNAPPLQLPEGIAVDLEASGIMGDLPFHYPGLTGNDQSVIVMFSPEGSVERVQIYRTPPMPRLQQAGVPECQIIVPRGNVALLLGRRELIPAPVDPNLTGASEAAREEAKAQLNWLNLESRWVTIGAQTGAVNTTANAFVNVDTLTPIDYDGNGDNTDPLDVRRTRIEAAREAARSAQRIGGG